MKFAIFKLAEGELLRCDECNKSIRGTRKGDIFVYLKEATRSDPPAVDKVLCVGCMDELKAELKDTDIKIEIVNE